MTLVINYAKQEDKVITMGKKDELVADYYPPGATEPIVRPEGVPPAEGVSEANPTSMEEAATTPPVAETVKEEKPSTKKAASKKR